jgi:hypothetical protein
MREETRIDLDSIPKILQAEVLVPRVLIIVVVRNWQIDHGRVARLLNKYIGILPPIVGRWIGSCPDVVMIAVTSIEKGRSSPVRAGDNRRPMRVAPPIPVFQAGEGEDLSMPTSSTPKECDRKSDIGSLRSRVPQ